MLYLAVLLDTTRVGKLACSQLSHLMSEITPLSPSALPPDGPDPALYVKGYRWPASRITKGDIAKLTELREQTGEPITQLLHEAIATYYRVLMEGEHDHS